MCVVKGWLAHLVTRLHLELKPTACQCLRKVVTCNVVAFFGKPSHRKRKNDSACIYKELIKI